MLVDPRTETRHTTDCGHIAVNRTPSRRIVGTTLFSTRFESTRTPDNVLVAVDGSPLAERTLTYALENFPDATITTIYVINPVEPVIDVEAGGLPVAKDLPGRPSASVTRYSLLRRDFVVVVPLASFVRLNEPRFHRHPAPPVDLLPLVPYPRFECVADLRG
jgi:hypothetical protein